MTRKYPITVRAEQAATSLEDILSSEASPSPDSTRTQVRVIGTHDATGKIAGILARYGFVCSGVEPERGHPDGTRYRCYLIAPTGKIK